MCPLYHYLLVLSWIDYSKRNAASIKHSLLFETSRLLVSVCPPKHARWPNCRQARWVMGWSSCCVPAIYLPVWKFAFVIAGLAIQLGMLASDTLCTRYLYHVIACIRVDTHRLLVFMLGAGIFSLQKTENRRILSRSAVTTSMLSTISRHSILNHDEQTEQNRYGLWNLTIASLN